MNEQDASDEKLSTAEKVLYSVIALCIVFGLMLVGWYIRTDRTSSIETPSSSYNGFAFNFSDGQWLTEWQGKQHRYQLAFRYHPEQLENVSVQITPPVTFNQLRGNPPVVYVTFDPTESPEALAYTAFANGMLSRAFVLFLQTNVTTVCTSVFEDVCPTNESVVTCDSPDDDGKAIIYLDNSPGAEVIVRNNCVIIRGEGEDLLRAAERFLYQSIFRIMKD